MKKEQTFCSINKKGITPLIIAVNANYDLKTIEKLVAKSHCVKHEAMQKISALRIAKKNQRYDSYKAV